jgi:exonuclease SbcD
MRVLHTSDWHLGRSLGEHKLIEQQALFTDWLVEAVRQEGVDVVVVSGDLFDRSLPPTDAWELLCDSFGRLRAEGAIVAAIAGNHDSAARIAATAGITDLAGIHMRGGFGGTAVTHLQVGEEPLSLVLVPYLNPHMAPEELAGELRGDGHSVTHERLIAHDLDRARSRLREGTPSLVLAHAFVTGAAPSDSERELAVGDAGMVSASVFGGFDYVALGHLHRPQEIAGSPSVRYSGSPLPYSFSERAPKSVVLADFSAGGLRSVEQVPIDVGRGVATVRGTLEELESGVGNRRDWVRAELTDELRPIDPAKRLRANHPHLAEVHWVGVGSRPEFGLTARGAALRSPMELISEFWRDVRGEEPSDAVLDVLDVSLAELERGAEEAA